MIPSEKVTGTCPDGLDDGGPAAANRTAPPSSSAPSAGHLTTYCSLVTAPSWNGSSSVSAIRGTPGRYSNEATKRTIGGRRGPPSAEPLGSQRNPAPRATRASGKGLRYQPGGSSPRRAVTN